MNNIADPDPAFDVFMDIVLDKEAEEEWAFTRIALMGTGKEAHYERLDSLLEADDGD